MVGLYKKEFFITERRTDFMKRMLKSKSGIIIILFAFITLLVSGCAKSGEDVLKSPEISEIEDTVMKSFDTSDMIKLDDKKLERVYGISADEVDEYFAYVSTSNIKADEVAVFKVKDSEDIEGIKSRIGERMVQLGTSFKDYLPEQYNLIEKHTLGVKGNYVFLAVSKDGESIKIQFDKCFK